MGKNNYAYSSQSESYRTAKKYPPRTTLNNQLMLVITFPYSLGIAPSHEIQSAHNEDRPRLIPDV